jgi:hypothetical protein
MLPCSPEVFFEIIHIFSWARLLKATRRDLRRGVQMPPLRNGCSNAFGVWVDKFANLFLIRNYECTSYQHSIKLQLTFTLILCLSAEMEWIQEVQRSAIWNLHPGSAMLLAVVSEINATRPVRRTMKYRCFLGHAMLVLAPTYSNMSNVRIQASTYSKRQK